MMDMFSKLVNKAVEFGLLEGFVISNFNNKLISYLLFLDDTLFFCKQRRAI